MQVERTVVSEVSRLRYVHHETRGSELRFCLAGGAGIFPCHMVERQFRNVLHLVGVGHMVQRRVAYIDQSGVSVSLGRSSCKALPPMTCGSMSEIGMFRQSGIVSPRIFRRR